MQKGMKKNSSIKEAKEFFDSHSFEKCLSICNDALDASEVDCSISVEKRYSWLVLKGASLQHLKKFNEAIDSLLFASNLMPNLALAWHGLLNIYEKLQTEENETITIKGKEGKEDFSESFLQNEIQRLLKILDGIYLKQDDSIKHYEIMIKMIDYANNAKLPDLEISFLERLLGDNDKFYQNVSSIKKFSKNHLLERIIVIMEKEENIKINTEIEKRRMRIDADPINILTEKIRLEITASSKLDEHLWDLMNEKIENLNGNAENDSNLSPWIDKLLDRLFDKIKISKGKDNFLKEKFYTICNKKLTFKSKRMFLDLQDVSDPSEYPSILPDVKDLKEMEIIKEEDKKKSISFLFEYCYSLLDNQDYLKDNIVAIQDSLKELENLLSTYKMIFNIPYDKMNSTLKRLKGQFLHHLQKYKEAESLLKESLPSSLSCYLDCLEALGKYDEIIDLLTNPSYSNPNLLGWIYYRMSKYKQAKESLLKALNASPNDPEVTFRLGLACKKLQQEARKTDNKNSLKEEIEESKTYFEKTLLINPIHSESYLYLGMYWEEMGGGGNEALAEKYFIKALQLNPDLPDAVVGLARIWYPLSSFSIIDSSSSISSLQGSSNDQGKISLTLIPLLESLVQKHPRHSGLWQYFGIIACNGNSKKQILAFQNALKGENCNQIQCLLLLALAFKRDGRHAASLKALSRILSIIDQEKQEIEKESKDNLDNSSHPHLLLPTLYYMAEAKANLAQFEESIQILTELLNNDTFHQFSTYKQEEIDNFKKGIIIKLSHVYLAYSKNLLSIDSKNDNGEKVEIERMQKREIKKELKNENVNYSKAKEILIKIIQISPMEWEGLETSHEFYKILGNAFYLLYLLDYHEQNDNGDDDEISIFYQRFNDLIKELESFELVDLFKIENRKEIKKGEKRKFIRIDLLNFSGLYHLKSLSLNDGKEEYWIDIGMIILSLYTNDKMEKVSIMENSTLKIVEDCAREALILSLFNSSSAWNLLGLVKMLQGQYEKSQHAFIKAIIQGERMEKEMNGIENDESNQSPSSNLDTCWINLSCLYGLSGDWELSMEALDKSHILLYHTEYSSFWYWAKLRLGRFQLKNQDKKHSCNEMLNEGIKSFDSTIHPFINILYLKEWQIDKNNKEIQIQGKESKDQFIKNENNEKEKKIIIMILKRIIALNSFNYCHYNNNLEFLWNKLGILLGQVGEYSQALDCFTIKTETEIKSETLLLNKLKILIEMGDLEGASQEFKNHGKFINFNIDNSFVLWFLDIHQDDSRISQYLLNKNNLNEQNEKWNYLALYHARNLIKRNESIDHILSMDPSNEQLKVLKIAHDLMMNSPQSSSSSKDQFISMEFKNEIKELSLNAIHFSTIYFVCKFLWNSEMKMDSIEILKEHLEKFPNGTINSSPLEGWKLLNEMRKELFQNNKDANIDSNSIILSSYELELWLESEEKAIMRRVNSETAEYIRNDLLNEENQNV